MADRAGNGVNVNAAHDERKNRYGDRNLQDELWHGIFRQSKFWNVPNHVALCPILRRLLGQLQNVATKCTACLYDVDAKVLAWQKC